MKKSLIALFVLSIFIVSFSVFSQQETITITTYYPAPFGVYEELRSKHMAIGDNYSLDAYRWEPPVCAAGENCISANADLVVEENVGIGTSYPTSSGGIQCLGKVGNYYNPKILVDISRSDLQVGEDAQLRVGGLILDSRKSGSNDIESVAERGTNGNLGLGAAGDIFFYTSYKAMEGNGTGRQKMYITNVGDVGIGTGESTPVAKLEVNGEVKVGNTGLVCNANTGGTMRYDSNTGTMQYCDNTMTTIDPVTHAVTITPIWKDVGAREWGILDVPKNTDNVGMDFKKHYNNVPTVVAFPVSYGDTPWIITLKMKNVSNTKVTFDPDCKNSYTGSIEGTCSERISVHYTVFSND